MARLQPHVALPLLVCACKARVACAIYVLIGWLRRRSHLWHIGCHQAGAEPTAYGSLACLFCAEGMSRSESLKKVRSNWDSNGAEWSPIGRLRCQGYTNRQESIHCGSARRHACAMKDMLPSRETRESRKTPRHRVSPRTKVKYALIHLQ